MSLCIAGGVEANPLGGTISDPEMVTMWGPFVSRVVGYPGLGQGVPGHRAGDKGLLAADTGQPLSFDVGQPRHSDIVYSYQIV